MTLTLYEATAHYLATVKEPRTSREIADALRAGGFIIRSSRFPTTVATMLARPEARHAGIRRTPDKKRWMYRRWRTREPRSRPQVESPRPQVKEDEPPVVSDSPSSR